jgi:hypothetical protein
MEMATVERAYLTYDEAEVFTSLHKTTIWRAVKAGELRATAALGGEHPPDCGNRLREAPRYLRPSWRAAPRASGFAGASGGAGCAAQLLHLAQRSTRPPPPGLCRLVGVVISTHTKRQESAGRVSGRC